MEGVCLPASPRGGRHLLVTLCNIRSFKLVLGALWARSCAQAPRVLRRSQEVGCWPTVQALQRPRVGYAEERFRVF